jgi:hypothetical protein
MNIKEKIASLKESLDNQSVEARELQLYIENDGELYTQRQVPIQKNLSRKFKNGTYDSEKAVKLWMYLVEDGARKYKKDFGSDGDYIFTKEHKLEVAKAMRDDWEEEMKAGNLHENLEEGKKQKVYAIEDTRYNTFEVYDTNDKYLGEFNSIEDIKKEYDLEESIKPKKESGEHEEKTLKDKLRDFKGIEAPRSDIQGIAMAMAMELNREKQDEIEDVLLNYHDGELNINETQRFILDLLPNQQSIKPKKESIEDEWVQNAIKDLEEESGEEIEVFEYPAYEQWGLKAVKSVSGDKEWLIAEDYDAAERVALNKVEEDLRNEPELFTPSWLEGHIDKDYLRDQLYDDVLNYNYDYYVDIADEDDDEFINRQRLELYEGDYITEEEAKDPNFDTTDAIEKAAEDKTQENLEDPLDYFREIYNENEALEQAIKIGRIDIEAAAEDAVSIDGVAHFLSGYDGNEIELSSGAYAYRIN